MQFLNKKSTGPADITSDLEGNDDALELTRTIYGDDFSELSTLFRADSPARIAILREAMAAGDRPRMAQVAHAFSGSCASIGAARLSALCKDLELLAKDAVSSGLEDKLAAVEAEYQRISARLQAMG